jgi:hypothetical protein
MQEEGVVVAATTFMCNECSRNAPGPSAPAGLPAGGSGERAPKRRATEHEDNVATVDIQPRSEPVPAGLPNPTQLTAISEYNKALLNFNKAIVSEAAVAARELALLFEEFQLTAVQGTECRRVLREINEESEDDA